jgi:hypothetical protein
LFCAHHHHGHGALALLVELFELFCAGETIEEVSGGKCPAIIDIKSYVESMGVMWREVADRTCSTVAGGKSPAINSINSLKVGRILKEVWQPDDGRSNGAGDGQTKKFILVLSEHYFFAAKF